MSSSNVNSEPVVYIKTTIAGYIRLLQLVEKDKRTRVYNKTRYEEKSGVTPKKTSHSLDIPVFEMLAKDRIIEL